MKDCDICKQFFEADSAVPNKFKCKLCSKDIKKNGSSYSNLGSHIRGMHPEELVAADQARKSGQMTLDASCFDARVIEIFSWMELVVMENLPQNPLL